MMTVMINIFEQTKYELKQSQFQQIVEIMNDFDKTEQFKNQPIEFINCSVISKLELKELNERDFKYQVALMNNFDKSELFKHLPINYIDCIDCIEIEVEEYEDDDDDDDDDDDEEDEDEIEEVLNYHDVMNRLNILNDGINYRKATLDHVLMDAEILRNILRFELNENIRGMNYRNPDDSIIFIRHEQDGKLELNYLLFMYVENFDHITRFRDDRNEVKKLSYRICEKIRRFLYKNT
jgi:hypothetical protein